MVKDRLPDNRDIETSSGSYSKRVEGDCVQGNKGDAIDQDGSLGVAVNKGHINAHNVSGTFNSKVDRHHNQAQTTINIENNYASVPDTSSGANALQAPATKESRTLIQAEAMFVLTGKLCAGNKVQLKAQKQEINAIVAHLQKRYNLDLTILDVTERSVRVKLS